MKHDDYDDSYIIDILSSVRTIAVVGASPNPARPSYGVTRLLIARGYEVYPVNPGQDGKEILGRMTYGRLADVPVAIDMIDVFRVSDALPGIVEEALKLDPLPKVIWTQLDVRHEDAAAEAESAGIKVVMDRCPAIEFSRLGSRIRVPAA